MTIPLFTTFFLEEGDNTLVNSDMLFLEQQVRLIRMV